MRWDAQGLVAETSLSRDPFRLVAEFVPLLGLFTTPTEPLAAVSEFLSKMTAAEATFADELLALVAALAEAGILIPAQGDLPLAPGWYAQAEPHMAMLADYARTAAYREMLMECAQDKVVVEIGCGSGALVCFAARAGARHVYAIEQTNAIEMAAEIVRRNGLADRVTFLRGNSLDVDLPEQADIVVSELIGTDPFGERMLLPLVDASRRFLKPGGMMLPERIVVKALGIDSPVVRDHEYLMDQKAQAARRLGSLYDLDLEPLVSGYLDGVAARRRDFLYEQRLGQFIGEQDRGLPETVLTQEFTLADLDLRSTELPARRSEALATSVHRSGMVNGLLTYFECYHKGRVVLSTSPYVTQHMENWAQIVWRLPQRHVGVGTSTSFLVTMHPDATPGFSVGWP